MQEGVTSVPSHPRVEGTRPSYPSLRHSYYWGAATGAPLLSLETTSCSPLSKLSPGLILHAGTVPG